MKQKNKSSLFDFDNIKESDFLNQFDLSDFEEDTETEHTDYEFQIRNLLALQPIFKLFIYQSNIDKETVSNDKIDAKIDWIYLSLVGLEYIAQVSLFQKGVLFEEFCSYLAKFAKHICPELDDESAYEKANRVFDAFINQKEKAREFEFYYYSPEQQKRISYQFRLIEVDKNNEAYYRLTKTGTEAYLLMRSIQPELYNNAEEIIVADLISSGKYKEAIFLAKRTQVRSNQYYKDIMEQLVEAQRDIHGFSYLGQLKGSLDDSTNHVKSEISKTSTRIESLDNAKQKSNTEGKAVRDINRLQQIFQLLSNSHDRLYTKLLNTDEDYLDIQANKFKKQLKTALPSLEKEIFPQILELNLEQLDEGCDTISLPFLSRNRKKRIFDLELAVELVTNSLEKESEIEIEKDEEDIVEVIEPSYPECFGKEVEIEAMSVLFAILKEKKEIKTYELMQSVHGRTKNTKVMDYLAYLIYGKYSQGSLDGIFVSIKKNGDKFTYLHMRGDSLTLKEKKKD